ncbi:MAG: ABC transporter permease [Acidobacteriia bacterium]|nr:ABC transporter permease [Terriglobia bacterium]
MIYDSAPLRVRQFSRDALTVIDQSGAPLFRKIAEYRQYWTLFVFLALRDITLRYRQTLLGVLWAVLQPLLPMAIFTAVFARVLRPSTGGVPYWLFVLAGMAPWTFFASAIIMSGNTFASNHGLLNKVYFPRAILPGAAVAACLLDYVVTGLFVLALVSWRGYRPTLEWLLLPVIALITTALAMSVGVALASLMAIYRDVKHVLPFLVQLWMFSTPIMYPINLLPQPVRPFIGLNPMAGVVEALRSCLFGTPPDWYLLALSGLSTVLIGFAAAFLFHRLEADLAERV